MNSTYTFRFVETNGIKLHCLEAGNKEGKLIILLHGFPEFWKGWGKQVDNLVTDGYFVLIPDQRGYNKSDKPWGVGKYKVDILAEDIIGLANHYNKEEFILGGHDWGAGVAWYIAAHYPERVKKLIIVNVPHTYTMMKFLNKDREQLKRSWYMFAFQIPLIPQLLLRRRNFKRLAESLFMSSDKGTFDDCIDEYIEAWGNKKSIPSMLNWYRAAMRRRVRWENTRIRMPLLIIWGLRDKFLKQEMAEDSLQYCDDGRVEYIDATHWVLHERPNEVNQLLNKFL
ncbi:MAG: alpha/beta hydrolase [Candidatus Heimdallarchaeota archaeon]|nr:alpha/beta hydrolase [Candidatus Heimdallarchaeota archaeon]